MCIKQICKQAKIEYITTEKTFYQAQRVLRQKTTSLIDKSVKPNQKYLHVKTQAN